MAHFTTPWFGLALTRRALNDQRQGYALWAAPGQDIYRPSPEAARRSAWEGDKLDAEKQDQEVNANDHVFESERGTAWPAAGGPGPLRST